MKRLLSFTIALIILILPLFTTSCGKGERIDDYNIVVPAECDITTKYAAEALATLAMEKTGKALAIVSDSEVEQKHEILLGETNREESKTTIALADKQYLLFKENEKIVIKGYGIYIGAGCGDLFNKYATVTDDGVDLSDVPSEEKVLTYTPLDTYNSVIFMIGDGMGSTHIEMTEYSTKKPFLAKGFPSVGASITRSLSVINKEASATDSAASGTAMATGYKTINGYIGLGAQSELLKNVRELAHESGAKTAIVTTDLITGATPSSYMCHNISRENDEELLAEINALVGDGKIDYCQGDVGDELSSHTKKALDTVSKDGSKFFVMIEEGIIDKASHSKEHKGVIDAVTRFNDAIAYATQYTLCHPDVALIVTADHETGNLILTTPGVYYFGSYAHTNKNVPIFAIGAGVDALNDVKIENVLLAQFCAKAYSSDPFGDQAYAFNK